jgi:hypothetical protein
MWAISAGERAIPLLHGSLALRFTSVDEHPVRRLRKWSQGASTVCMLARRAQRRDAGRPSERRTI